jgi:hypothetical protein
MALPYDENTQDKASVALNSQTKVRSEGEMGGVDDDLLLQESNIHSGDVNFDSDVAETENENWEYVRDILAVYCGPESHSNLVLLGESQHGMFS